MPQKSPGSLRSPRNRGLELGTYGTNSFPENAAGNYNPSAGVPDAHAGGNYKQDTTATPDPGPTVNPSSPFKLGQ